MSENKSRKNSEKYSESIFSDSDSSLATAKIKQATELERKKRQRNFLKYILPFCLLFVFCLAHILRKPLLVIFRGPPPFEMPQEQEFDSAAEASGKDQKHFGNPDADMKVYLRFADEFFAPEDIIELAQSAAESKPSEIFLSIEFRHANPGEPEYQILINGQSEIAIGSGNGQRKIDFKQTFKTGDFIAALEGFHAQVYGQVSKPLKLSLSPETLEKRRLERESAPPLILPAKSANEIKSGDKAILLPDFKADTTISP